MINLLEELESVDIVSESLIVCIKINFMNELSIVLYLKSEGMKHALSDKQRASHVDDRYRSMLKVIVSLSFQSLQTAMF